MTWRPGWPAKRVAFEGVGETGRDVERQRARLWREALGLLGWLSHGGRRRLEAAPASDWRAQARKALGLKRRRGLSWRVIARAHVNVGVSQLREWVRRLEREEGRGR